MHAASSLASARLRKPEDPCRHRHVATRHQHHCNALSLIARLRQAIPWQPSDVGCRSLNITASKGPRRASLAPFLAAYGTRQREPPPKCSVQCTTSWTAPAQAVLRVTWAQHEPFAGQLRL